MLHEMFCNLVKKKNNYHIHHKLVFDKRLLCKSISYKITLYYFGWKCLLVLENANSETFYSLWRSCKIYKLCTISIPSFSSPAGNVILRECVWKIFELYCESFFIWALSRRDIVISRSNSIHREYQNASTNRMTYSYAAESHWAI